MEKITAEINANKRIIFKSIFLFIISVVIMIIPFIAAFNGIGKILFILGGIILIIYGIYEIKYAIGVREYGIEIDLENKKVIYFEEFVGQRELDVEKIKEYKLYRKGKKIFMIEVYFDEEQKEKETINLTSFGNDDVFSILRYMKQMNPYMREVEKTTNK